MHCLSSKSITLGLCLSFAFSNAPAFGDFIYEISLIGLEPVATLLNDQVYIPVHSDLNTPYMYSQGMWTTPSKKPWDHIHAYLGVAVYDFRAGKFDLNPVAYNDGSENYFTTNYWDGSRLVSSPVQREPHGVGTFVKPSPPVKPSPMTIGNVIVTQSVDDRVVVSITGDSRTSQANRKFLADQQENNLCYIKKRAERAALHNAMSSDLPAIGIRGPGCEPIWTVPTEPAPAIPRRFGSMVSEGCDSYIAAHDFVLNGKLLFDITSNSTGTAEYTQDVLTVSTKGCWTWNLAPSGVASRSNPTNIGTRTRISIRVRRVGEYIPDLHWQDPGECTLRPIKTMDLSLWTKRWGLNDDSIVANAWLGAGQLLSAKTEARTLSIAAENLNVSPTALDILAYAGDYAPLGDASKYIGVTNPVSPLCSHFVGLPDYRHVADWDVTEQTHAISLSNGVQLALYGEYDRHGRFLTPRLRYYHKKEDRMLKSKPIIH